MKYAYYPGCSLEATAVEYDLSARAVAGALGLEMAELPDWNCCGATSAHSLHHTLAGGLAARNIGLAQESGLDVVVPCSACYSRLSKADYLLRNSPQERSHLEEIAGFTYKGNVKVLSLLEVLSERLKKAPAKSVNPSLKGLKMVCYYGCLLTRPPETSGFDRVENPVSMDQLISSLGISVLNWSYKTECCGASLSLTDSNVVYKLVGTLLEAAARTGADAVATACPLCHSNLEIRRPPGNSMPVFYFTELIGLALGLDGAEKWFSKHLVDPRQCLQAIR